MGFIEKAVEKAHISDGSKKSVANRVEKGLYTHKKMRSSLVPGMRNKPFFVSSNDIIVDLNSRLDNWPLSEFNSESVKNEYRKIKQPLLSNILQDKVEYMFPQNLVMVTSSVENEGKTYTAINLALSLANEHNITIVLVDADLHKSELTHKMRLESKRGISDYLNGSVNHIEDILYNTSWDSLKIIPAGSVKTDAPELFSSNSMRFFIDQLSRYSRECITIFDTAPLLHTSESQIIANLLGQIALVVRAGDTPCSLVEESLSLFDSNKPIGIILNRVSSFGSSNYYGYGYNNT